jgi:general secretion pathway protein C
MLNRFAVAVLHVSMLALVSAIGAYWVIRIVTPPPASVPPAPPAAVLREADPVLAARMFGLVQAPTQARQALNIEALGAYAAGRQSAAVLAVDGRPARVFLLDQEVADGVRLVEVRKDAVAVEQGGARREFALPPPPSLGVGGPPPAPGFTREGSTLTAPTVAGTAPVPAMPNRPLSPRPQVMQPAVAQQPQAGLPQTEQGEQSPETGNERGVRSRVLAQ